MPHAIITIAFDLDRAGKADRLRGHLVRHLEAIEDSVKVTESSVAVDERLAHEDVDD